MVFVGSYMFAATLAVSIMGGLGRNAEGFQKLRVGTYEHAVYNLYLVKDKRKDQKVCNQLLSYVEHNVVSYNSITNRLVVNFMELLEPRIAGLSISVTQVKNIERCVSNLEDEYVGAKSEEESCDIVTKIDDCFKNALNANELKKQYNITRTTMDFEENRNFEQLEPFIKQGYIQIYSEYELKEDSELKE